MKLIIAISAIFCIAVAYGETEPVCSWTATAHMVCMQGAIIVSVHQRPLHRVKELELTDAVGIVNNAFRNITIEYLIIKQHYTSLSMANGAVHPSPSIFLDSLTFNGLPNLSSLGFYDTHLYYEDDQLVPLKKLRQLTFVNNDLTRVPTEMIQRASDLWSLRIAYNNIPVIRKNAFAGLNKLWGLDLVRNNITSLEPGCFYGLESLEKLDLSYNKLTLADNIFSSLKKLQFLGLYHAAKTNGISSDAFRGLPSLTRLFLQVQGHLALKPGMFNDSPKLEIIDISSGILKHIPKNVFNCLRSLSKLFLLDCGIESIEAGAFSGLNLTEFHMVSSALISKIIQTGTFAGVRATIMSLQENGIEDLRPRAFDGLKASLLKMNSNRIDRLVADTFAGAEIEELDLRYNVIKLIEPNAFRNAKIQSLIVDPNSIVIGNKSRWGIPDNIKVVVKK